MTFINAHLPPKASGKPATNKDYEVQGWNASRAGISIDDCPYFPTSTAEKYWKRGHRSNADATAPTAWTPETARQRVGGTFGS